MIRLVFYGLAGLTILAFAALYTGAVYRAGKDAVRAENLKAANDSLKRMEIDRVEIGKLDRDAYCAEFGYRWLPNEGKCG